MDALQRASSPELETRQRAEEQLAAGAAQPGFGPALLTLALAQDLTPGIRQLAAGATSSSRSLCFDRGPAELLGPPSQCF